MISGAHGVKTRNVDSGIGCSHEREPDDISATGSLILNVYSCV